MRAETIVDIEKLLTKKTAERSKINAEIDHLVQSLQMAKDEYNSSGKTDSNEN